MASPLALHTGPSLDQATREGCAWAGIKGVWRQLHGSFSGQGLSVEWHDFRLEKDMDWGRSFHPGSMEICLNFSGAGWLRDGQGDQELAAEQVAVYTLQNQRLRAVRRASSLHRFLTLEISPAFLRAQFGDELTSLKAPIQRFAQGGTQAPPYLEISTMPSSLLGARLQFVQPPVSGPALRAWYLGRTLEILAQTVFREEEDGELFCQRHQRVNRLRVERARFVIERDLENPPSLEMLGREVGCSPFYLSRIFSQETGVSIPKFLRMKRVEKAAEMLREGKANVTEAAVSVGYSSLSAFSKAFVEHFGCCPGLYPHFRIPGREKPRP